MNLPTHFVLTALLTAGLPALAQETIPNEEAVRVSRQLLNAIGSPSDAPFTTDIDPEKPHGFKVSGAGLMALPDRKLTTTALEHAEKNVLPLGQLWSLEVSLATGGKPIARDQLRLVTLGEGDKARTVQLYYLGAAKNDTGELQLLIFAKNQTQPFLRVPLKHVTATSQSAPIELDGRRQDENTGTLTIRFLGEYSAEVTVMKPQE